LTFLEQLVPSLRTDFRPGRKVRAAQGAALLKNRYLRRYGSKEEKNRPGENRGKGEKVG